MFQLVTAVVATILMIAVGIAGLSYLGTAYHTAAARAEVAQFVNGSTQILGAAALYRSETGGGIADAPGAPALGTLTQASYLTNPPAPPKSAVPGATWKLTMVNGVSVVSIELDDASPATASICALAKDQGAGCADDVASITP